MMIPVRISASVDHTHTHTRARTSPVGKSRVLLLVVVYRMRTILLS